MPDLDLKTVLGFLGALAAAFLAYLGGDRNGRAAYITAISEAEGRLNARLESEVERVTARCDLAEAAERQCRAELAEMKDRFNLLRAGICPPAYEIGKDPLPAVPSREA